MFAVAGGIDSLLPLLLLPAQSVDAREPVTVAAIIIDLAEPKVLRASWPFRICRTALGSSTHTGAAVPVRATSGTAVTYTIGQ